MDTTRLVSAGVIAALLLGAAAAVATAQTAPAPGPEPEAAAPEPPPPGLFERLAERRAEREGRRTREGRGHRGHGGPFGPGFGGPGFGGPGGGEMMQMLFEEVDADGDGAVTQAEIDAFRAAKVGTADASGDGGLTLEEFETLYREFTRLRMVRAFQALDTDGDGVISQAEMDRRFGRVVERMDRNGDGVLTLEDHGRPRD
ncbi:MAG: EF-hand domain-containing protein [Rhodobacteraceae bacterium]|nr:EF-hand domain-containing protein [Paracoccaceae bacterium]